MTTASSISFRLQRVVLALYWAALATGSHWPNLDLARTVGLQNRDVPLGIDKWAHVFGFAGLAFLALMAGIFHGRRRMVFKTWALVAAYAIVDEVTQLAIAGREFGLDDMVASNIGVALGCIGWIVFVWLADHDNSFVAHTRVVSALTLVSRSFGLIRDWSLAYAFGFGGLMDAFNTAFQIPNLFRRLFGEGAMSASFTPQYARLNNASPSSARRFLFRTVIWIGGWLVALGGAGLIVLLMLREFGELSERGVLTVNLTMITLWYAPLVCMAAIIGAALQVHDRFGPSSASPIILNLILISACIWSANTFNAADQAARGTMFVAAAVVAAGVVQLVWHLAVLPPRNEEHAVDAAMVGEARTALMTQWLPTVLGLAVFQINTLADTLMVLFFSPPSGEVHLLGMTMRAPMEVGSVSVMNAAQRLYEFPLGVFGIAVATAIFPQLARAAGDEQRFTDLLRQGLRLTVFIGLPASAGLLLVSGLVTRAIFHGEGAMSEEDAPRIAWVLIGYAPAVWAYSMNQVLTRAFYAHRDAKTPLRIGMGMVGLNLLLNLVLIWPLGAAGPAWSTAVCAMIQSALLLRALRRYVKHPLDAAVLRAWMKTLGLAMVMSAAIMPLLLLVDARQLSRVELLVFLAGVCGLGGGVFLVTAKLVKMQELRWLLHRTSTPTEAAAAGE